MSTDPDALERLENAGKIVFTPCKNLPGQRSSSYDDRMIIELAEHKNAAIISNDNYADLLQKSAGECLNREIQSSRLFIIVAKIPISGK